ncbi:MAG: polymer-forming cytoskeletal protein [Pseudomonadales bacterium]|nr:polymer-forming cytoskeletal protein [Pseudomonadales bacterium]
MFGNKKPEQRGRSGERSLIAAGTQVVGEIQFSGHIEVRGIVLGNIVAEAGVGEASVVVLPGGKVQGDIVAPTVVIDSMVEGNIYAGTRVELAAGAEVCGDVHYQIIEMVQGSQVNGSLLYSPVDANAFDNTQSGSAQDESKATAADALGVGGGSVNSSTTSAKAVASASKTTSASPAKKSALDEAELDGEPLQDKQSALL